VASPITGTTLHRVVIDWRVDDWKHPPPVLESGGLATPRLIVGGWLSPGWRSQIEPISDFLQKIGISFIVVTPYHPLPYYLVTSMKRSELTIFTRKSPFLQACDDAARNNHRYMTGLVDDEKFAELHAKMSRKYDLDLEKVAAYRLRKAGKATCRMLIYKLPHSYSIENDELGLPVPNRFCQWVMFASEGTHPIGDEGDVWLDFAEDKLTTPGGLEMFRHTRPKDPANPKKKSAAPSWSWRFSADYYSALRNSAIASIKRREEWHLKLIIDEAKKTPGFAGVREQLKKLVALIKGEWVRTMGNAKQPELPTQFGYVRRITAKKVSLAWVLKQTREEMAMHQKRLDSIKAEAME
jgi:hypothetical protein